ncbi:MAG: DUF3617 family protein [Pseudomonadota bacterium]
MSMLMNRALLTPALVLLITACSGQSEGSPEAGQYRQIVTITDIDFPGMTEDQKKQTVAQMESAANIEESALFCLDQANHGAQWKQAASQMANMMGGQCETLKDEGSATRIDTQLRCEGTAQGNVDIAMTGASHTQGYESTISFRMSDPNSEDTARLAMTSTGERIGDCPG